MSDSDDWRGDSSDLSDVPDVHDHDDGVDYSAALIALGELVRTPIIDDHSNHGGGSYDESTDNAEPSVVDKKRIKKLFDLTLGKTRQVHCDCPGCGLISTCDFWDCIGYPGIRPSVAKFMIDEVFDLDNPFIKQNILHCFNDLLGYIGCCNRPEDPRRTEVLLEMLWGWLSKKAPEDLLTYGRYDNPPGTVSMQSSPGQHLLFSAFNGHDARLSTLYVNRILNLWEGDADFARRSRPLPTISGADPVRVLFRDEIDVDANDVQNAALDAVGFDSSKVKHTLLWQAIITGDVTLTRRIARMTAKYCPDQFFAYEIDYHQDSYDDKLSPTIYQFSPLLVNVMRHMSTVKSADYLKNVAACIQVVMNVMDGTSDGTPGVSGGARSLIHMPIHFARVTHRPTVRIDDGTNTGGAAAAAAATVTTINVDAKIGRNLADYMIDWHMLYDGSPFNDVFKRATALPERLDPGRRYMFSEWWRDGDVSREKCGSDGEYEEELLFNKYDYTAKDPMYAELFIHAVKEHVARYGSITFRSSWWSDVPGFDEAAEKNVNDSGDADDGDADDGDDV